MVTESYDYQEVEKTMMYYSTPLVKESDFPFNFYLLDLPQNKTGQWVKHLVDLWMANMPNGQWANWVVRHFFSSFARIQQSFHFFMSELEPRPKQFKDEVWSVCHAIVVTMVTASLLWLRTRVVQALSCKLQTPNNEQERE